MKKLLFLFLFFCTLDGSAQISTEGTDFWVGFMNNWDQDPEGNPIQLEIYISAKDTTTGFLEMPQLPGFPIKEFQVVPEVATLISIPTSVAMAEWFGRVEGKGIHIQTQGEVSVYAMNKRQYSSDISVILPTISLGKNYLVTAHWEDGNRNNGDNSDSEFLIVATADGTRVEITPSVTTQDGQAAGAPYEVELSRGQVYQMQARGDLTGTKVVAKSDQGECQNFALFAGNRYTKVGECDHPDGHDHLYAQMYPTNTWGTSFITIPFKTRAGGDLFKVIASEDNTTIDINDQTLSLDAGEHFRTTLDNVNRIVADKPISVAQFSRSQACDNSRSDPFVVLVSPKEQLLREVTFNAPPGNNLNGYFLNVLIPSTDINSFTLDGIPRQTFFEHVPGEEAFMYAQIGIYAGNHTLKSPSGFSATVYGYGNNESFGFVTGASLENLSLEVFVEDGSGQLLDEDNLCWKTEVTFRPATATFFNEFTWDFGDGTQMVTDQPESQQHTYENPGTYLVQVVASRFDASCASGGQEVSLKLITVTAPEAEILGPRSVCPNTPGVVYLADGSEDFSYEWSFDGGSDGVPKDDSLTIDWGNASEDAFVSVVATNSLGCVGPQIIHPVKINVQLEPEAPFGPDSLCSIDKNNVLYHAYSWEGAQFDWEISGGSITSSDTLEQVTVDWDGPGTGAIWFYQSSALDDICGGGSDTAAVFVERNPSLEGILTGPDRVMASQGFQVELEVDSTFRLANWYENGKSIADTLAIGPLDYVFNCEGTYTLAAEVFDTLGVCKASRLFQKEILVELPDLEILHVTNELIMDSTLFVRWKEIDFTTFHKPIELFRRESEGSWQTVDTIGNTLEWMDTGIYTSSMTYSYSMQTNGDCATALAAEDHQSILLDVTHANQNEASFAWNDYKGWKEGVETYEVWLSIDEGELHKLSSQSGTSFQFQDDNRGFDYCFTIKALEYQGNRSYSYSNTACARFYPEIVPYNVFSPNGDNWNQTFQIDGIELYPNSILTVVNRYGKVVYKATGYQNTWNGGDLSAGVYFWSLQLNEPRIDIEEMNGEVSILR